MWSRFLFLFPLIRIQTGFFSTSGTGGGASDPPLCNFKTAYAMATKFAQDRVRANSNHFRYCDVFVTSYDVIMTPFM